MNHLKRFSEWMLRQRFPLVPVLAGLLLALPGLWGGLNTDDLMMRALTVGRRPLPGIEDTPWQPNTILVGDADYNHTLMDYGWIPWWADPECRIIFLRPLTAVTHMLDYLVWPDQPWLMHLQSLLWYALLIAAAAMLYRRVLGHAMPAWFAALAALLFAIDYRHAMPVGWIANRCTLSAALFTCLSLLAYDRWRQDGWKPGAALAPLALAASLLSKESGLCALAYLLAYAVFLDRGPLWRRLAAMVPCLLVGVAWAACYKMFGYGAFASGGYIEPLHDPVLFAEQFARNAPILLLSQLGVPSSDTSLFLSASAFWWHWGWAIVYLALLSVLLAPLLARDRVARFWAAGMVLCVVPVCATVTNDRLLMFVSLGAMGLLAQWLGAWTHRTLPVPRSAVRRGLVRVFAPVLIGVHVVVAIILFPVSTMYMQKSGTYFNEYFATFPQDAQIEEQTVVVVNAISWYSHLFLIQSRRYTGKPLPERSLSLLPSAAPGTLTRTDARTLVVRPTLGYLPPAGFPRDHGQGAPPFSFGYMLQRLDLILRRPDHPMQLGETVELTTATIEITNVTADGRPAEATFRFRVPLEDASLRWLHVTEYGYRPFTPPAVGETVRVWDAPEDAVAWLRNVGKTPPAEN
ncbi:MAG: hypothetical protein JXA69_07105 [Phycisphaerae bacterium]|nr:hypothetical protein [Phycisphaerae bacterium]